ncbi:hypothetical protein GCM10027160_37390 [Streptomyces calidiresistens]
MPDVALDSGRAEAARTRSDHHIRKVIRAVETVGWAAAAVAALAGCVWVLSYVLEQVPPLSAKAIAALVALRKLRKAWRGQEE